MYPIYLHYKGKKSAFVMYDEDEFKDILWTIEDIHRFVKKAKENNYDFNKLISDLSQKYGEIHEEFDEDYYDEYSEIQQGIYLLDNFPSIDDEETPFFFSTPSLDNFCETLEYDCTYNPCIIYEDSIEVYPYIYITEKEFPKGTPNDWIWKPSDKVADSLGLPIKESDLNGFKDFNELKNNYGEPEWYTFNYSSWEEFYKGIEEYYEDGEVYITVNNRNYILTMA